MLATVFIMTGLQGFKDVVDEYKSAYKKYNNKEVTNLEYKNGFVYYLTTLVSGGFNTSNKYRIGQFEKMTETLKSRLNGG